MKIAILTFFKAKNYGGDLQAFALQRKLRDMKYDVEVLNLHRPRHPKFIKTDNFQPIYIFTDKVAKKSKRNDKVVLFLKKFFNVFLHKNMFIKNERFERFERDYINLSSKVFYNFDQLYNENLNYDTYIVGSDQVWNYEYPFSPEPYFLTFAKKGEKKIAYAASIGHDSIPESIKDLYKKWLTGFDYISLREEQGEKIIKNLTEKDVCTVLDPTLLIPKIDWVRYLSIKNSFEEKYLLIYTLSRSKYINRIAKIIAKKLNLKIKQIGSGFWTFSYFDNIQNIHSAGPIEFIDLFNNATFVLTNSFHGTAFSVNFNIPFFSILRKKNKKNSRFISLLNKCQLYERLVFEDDQEFNFIENLSVDFSNANQLLSQERKHSLQYIEKAINT